MMNVKQHFGMLYTGSGYDGEQDAAAFLTLARKHNMVTEIKKDIRASSQGVHGVEYTFAVSGTEDRMQEFRPKAIEWLRQVARK